MHALSIKVNDFLNTSFYSGSGGYTLITAVAAPTVVAGINSYQVTAGGKVYTCTIANTTIEEKLLNGVSSWVIGA